MGRLTVEQEADLQKIDQKIRAVGAVCQRELVGLHERLRRHVSAGGSLGGRSIQLRVFVDPPLDRE